MTIKNPPARIPAETAGRTELAADSSGLGAVGLLGVKTGICATATKR